ncbi:hypothetical protein [Gemmobacter denitrificans]|uniref:Uncharacterized protein n=1 Tax=Gemmobacter denitrificans TaxID=3123040 RepID=A0ABU8BS80_9RHOB
MAEVITLKLFIPWWRKAVVQVWIRVLVIQEMIFPESVDVDSEAERMARFLCRIVVDG